jgi:hypothetical protein
MADTLAFLHWVAKIDANDVEFVVGGLRPSMNEHDVFTSDTLGRHAVWVLDFDCCKPLSLDEAGIEQAARAFWRNDPYYPRPPGEETSPQDTQLWHTFADRFLQTSRKMLVGSAENVQRLPDMLVARIIETRGVYARAAIV